MRKYRANVLESALHYEVDWSQRHAYFIDAHKLIRYKDLSPTKGNMDFWPIWAVYEAIYLVEPLADLAFALMRCGLCLL